MRFVIINKRNYTIDALIVDKEIPPNVNGSLMPRGKVAGDVTRIRGRARSRGAPDYGERITR